jgi:hypothetical protein
VYQGSAIGPLAAGEAMHSLIILKLPNHWLYLGQKGIAVFQIRAKSFSALVIL